MQAFADYPQDGFKKIIIASALTHGALILFGLYIYKGEVKEYISPVYTVSLVTQAQVASDEPATGKSAEKATYAPSEPKVAPAPKTALKDESGFAFKSSVKKTLIEDSINNLKEKIKDKEDAIAIEKRIDALKKKNTITAPAKKVANKTMAYAETASASAQQTHSGKPPAQNASTRPLHATTSAGGAGSIANKHDAYYNYIGKRVQDEWDYPIEFEKSNIEVIVSVKIDRDGSVLASNIEKSSGSRAFDESLLAAIKKVGRFAPLPKTFTDDFLEAGFTFCPSCAEQKITIKKPSN